MFSSFDQLKLISSFPELSCLVNDHSMITRAKASISKPEVVYIVTILLVSKSWKFAIDILERKASMQREYAALIRNVTWELVPLP